MKFKQNVFLCFSPPVMIATCIIELSYFVFILLKKARNTTSTLVLLMLACLAIFQLAEYGICEMWGLNGALWAKIGFCAITLLPVFGLHLVYILAKKKLSFIVPVAYVLAATWVGIFIFAGALRGSVCSGNYVIFHIPDMYEVPYYFFYDTLLFIAMCVTFYFAEKTKDKKQRYALQSLGFGYLSFILPSMFFSTYDAHGGADSNLPSVMCGFAVIFASFLTFRTLAHNNRKR